MSEFNVWSGGTERRASVQPGGEYPCTSSARAQEACLVDTKFILTSYIQPVFFREVADLLWTKDHLASMRGVDINLPGQCLS